MSILRSIPLAAGLPARSRFGEGGREGWGELFSKIEPRREQRGIISDGVNTDEGKEI
jgi:hypothetical protein